MRITHLTASGELGGAERVALECMHAARSWNGVEVSLVALGRGRLVDAAASVGARATSVEAPSEVALLGDAFASAGATIRAMAPALQRFPGFYRRFGEAVKVTDPDVIHSHGIKTHVLSALMPRQAPVVWHIHDYLGTRSISSRLARLLGNRCDLAIAVSESVADDARRVLPASVPVVAIHNAIDTDRFVPDGPAADLDALAGLPAAAAGTLRIGLPATFARWKGHEIFLQAISRIKAANIRAYVIGDAIYDTQNSQWTRAELESIARDLGISHRVGFTGAIDDMPAAYRALDIVVHASTRPEPFGLVIAEAMSCGRALVAAPEGGAGELFVDGVHGLAARGGDVVGLARAIDDLIARPDRRAAFGAAARDHAVRAFGRHRFSRALAATMERIPTSSIPLEAAR
ncbi:MAG TPA: glycosyltransferase [Gemmatimonadaceae bacterium]|nr:glycosyltransferase [Gemmatimonadaceae bacterium]